MIPSIGSYCDVCALGVHYRLDCQKCGRVWEEPSFPVEFTCPRCGASCDVTPADHDLFAELVRAGARPLASTGRQSGVWGWARQAQLRRERSR